MGAFLHQGLARAAFDPDAHFRMRGRTSLGTYSNDVKLSVCGSVCTRTLSNFSK